MNRGSIITVLCLALLLQSCVQNRLPDPVFVPNIKEIKADGALGVNIDQSARCVTFTMDEIADLSKVNVTSCTFNNDDIVCPDKPVVGVHDLTSPKAFIFSTYSQNYEWIFKAVQPISREFTVKGQLGDCTIDEQNHRVLLKVTKSTPRTWITVTSCKLGPRDITQYSEDPLQIRNFSEPRTLGVKYRDCEQQWTIIVENSTLDVDMRRISPRVHSCFMEAEAPQGALNGFVLRKSGDTEWKQIDSVSSSAGKIVGYADSLLAETTYECMAFSNADTTIICTFTTGTPVQLPNADLEESYNTGSYFEFYNPASTKPECTQPWWGSGNGCFAKGVTGSADMGFVICAPDRETSAQGRQSARLQSAWAVVKFAAGNLFCGEFAGLVGTRGGMVNFGRPFTSRPSAMSFMVRYINGPIDHVDGYPEKQPVKEGDPDKAQVYIALGTWDAKTYGGTQDSPVQVNTTDTKTFFNPLGKDVIAYGTWITDQKISEWTNIVIPIVYTDNFTEPTHIIISCAASYLGDYFTGCSESKLWIDDFQLIY